MSLDPGLLSESLENVPEDEEMVRELVAPRDSASSQPDAKNSMSNSVYSSKTSQRCSQTNSKSSKGK